MVNVKFKLMKNNGCGALGGFSLFFFSLYSDMQSMQMVQKQKDWVAIIHGGLPARYEAN